MFWRGSKCHWERITAILGHPGEYVVGVSSYNVGSARKANPPGWPPAYILGTKSREKESLSCYGHYAHDTGSLCTANPRIVVPKFLSVMMIILQTFTHLLDT